MTPQEQELAASYAAMILADAGKDVTVDALSAVLKAANVTVEPYVPMLFARACNNIDVNDLMTNVGSGAGAAAGPAGGAAAGGEAAVEEEKKSSSEESDEEMGFSLFD